MADECFLVGIPFLIVTMFMREWPFGTTMCKIYFTTTSINQITSSLFLMVLSADRYIAVCHPISSPRLRTGTIAKVTTSISIQTFLWSFPLQIVSCSVWLVSAVLMLPVFLYATTISRFLTIFKFGSQSINFTIFAHDESVFLPTDPTAGRAARLSGPPPWSWTTTTKTTTMGGTTFSRSRPPSPSTLLCLASLGLSSSSSYSTCLYSWGFTIA